MENKEAPVSFYVLASFGLLFLVFFFLGQPGTSEKPRGNEVSGAIAVSDITSTAGYIVIGTIVILIAGFSFIFLKKMATKKKALKSDEPEVPVAEKNVELPGSKLEDKHKSNQEKEIPDTDIDELFGKDEEPHIKAPSPYEKTYEPVKNEQNFQKQMVNSSELKGKIKSKLMENMDKDDIFNLLMKEGYTMQQIEMATDDINLETLKDYIKKSMQRGLSKSQIFESLRSKNWRTDLINKAFLSIQALTK